MDEIKENLRLQLDELESLQAMFYNPGEVKIEEMKVLNEIKHFVDGQREMVPPCLDYAIRLMVDTNKFEMGVSLALEYPCVEPEVFVRNPGLSRMQHVELNRKMGVYIKDLPRGEPCIFAAITWLQDNGANYIQLENLEPAPKKPQKQEEQVRYWIYSHHIYSRTKRKNLIELADQLKVSGFVLPGKPGVICVEGDASDVVEWWTTVKSMNWKKIFCKIIESSKDDQIGAKFLKFTGFTEQVFDSQGIKFNHMDMGAFYRYLDINECGHIFEQLFGIDMQKEN